MDFRLAIEPANDLWSRPLAVLLDSGAKGVILLALAWLIVAGIRRSSPARRHLVWTLALGGLLLLPLGSLIMPRWNLPILPRESRSMAPTDVRSFSATAPEASRPLAQPAREPDRPAAQTSAAGGREMLESHVAPTAAPLSPLFWIVAAWAVGAVAALMPLLAGMLAVSALVRRARPFEGEEWNALLGSLSGALALRRSVRLLSAGSAAMPMAAGLIHPALLLPEEAADWPEEKRRSVLLHELAHVKRWDCLTHALARLAVAVHWFNPLAWLALRAMRIERERACDDLVLAAGERPSVYAEHLLDIARRTHASPMTSAAAVTMAEKSHLEGRLRAILDATRKRKAVRLGLIISGVLLVLAVAIPLSALKLSEARVFADMTPEQKARFDKWYTEKISIPGEELRVPPYDPSLLEAVRRFFERWEQDKAIAQQIQDATGWSKLADDQNPALPESFTDRHREQLEKVRPLLNDWKAVVLHPEYTVDVLTAAAGSSFNPTQEVTSRWKAVQTAARLTYADVLIHLERRRPDEALEGADALVAAARVEPYSSALQRMVAIAVLRNGIRAYRAIGGHSLTAAQRDSMVAAVEARRGDLDAETSYTASLNALTLDHIGITMKARRNGLTPDLQDVTGYEVMREVLRFEREYLEKVSLPQAANSTEKDAVLQALELVRQMSQSLEKPGGVKRILSPWIEPVTAAYCFSVALPALKKARANATEVLEEYDRLNQELKGSSGAVPDARAITGE
ncbi:MAG: M56 family metallopeptidase [Gemmatimonadetes bacterium]|nr:M56 family metallopeptidase [Gemmatimonadota bacterium]